MIINNHIITGSRSTISPEEGSGISAKDVLIYVNGANDISSATKAVTIGDQNTIKANIFAPNGTIQINERTSVDGALIGKDVYIGDKVKVTMYNGFLGQSLTCDINAEPETITMGESTTLSWCQPTQPQRRLTRDRRCCGKRLYGGLSHAGHDLYNHGNG